MRRVRATLALTFPPEVARELDWLRKAIGSASVERIPPHVTLVPPVQCSLGELDQLRRRLVDFALATAPISVTLEGAAIFHTAREVVYLPVVDGGITGEMAFELGLVGDRPFVPHVTIWQGKSERRALAVQAALDALVKSVEVDRVTLMVADGMIWAQETSVLLGRGGRRIRGGVDVAVAVVTTPSRWRLDHCEQRACVAYQMETLVAEAVARRITARAWEIEHVQVYDEDLQGRGLGRLVMRELLEDLSGSVFVSQRDHRMLEGLGTTTLAALDAEALGLDQSKSWKAWSFSSR